MKMRGNSFTVVISLLLLVSGQIKVKEDDEFSEFDLAPDSELVEEDDRSTSDSPVRVPTERTENEFDTDNESFLEVEDEDDYIEEDIEENSREKPPSTGEAPMLKINEVPDHLRTTWKSYWWELLVIVGLVVYAANFYLGREKNAQLAKTWFSSHRRYLENQFSFVGDDGMSPETQRGVLVKENDTVFTLWCTGRQFCEGMLVELKLLKRQDLVSVLGYFFQPQTDIMNVVIFFEQEEVENFVFGLVTKKYIGRFQKEKEDIVEYGNEKHGGEKFGLNNQYIVLTEVGEIASFILNHQSCTMIEKASSQLVYVHITDQYSPPKKEDSNSSTTATVKPSIKRKVLSLQFKFGPGLRYNPGATPDSELMLKLVLYLAERCRMLRLSKEAKLRQEKSRREVAELNMKQSHTQRQEAAMQRRDEKRRAELDKIMQEGDSEKQRRFEEREQKKEMKRKGPKVKAVKIRM